MDKLFREVLRVDLGDVSHQLVSISPGATRDAFHLTFLTHYIYEKFLDRLSAHKLEAAARLYDILVQNPNTKVPAGFMLEDAVNDVFYRGGVESCSLDEVKSCGSKIYSLEESRRSDNLPISSSRLPGTSYCH
jgi:hypothetical protein